MSDFMTAYSANHLAKQRSYSLIFDIDAKIKSASTNGMMSCTVLIEANSGIVSSIKQTFESRGFVVTILNQLPKLTAIKLEWVNV